LTFKVAKTQKANKNGSLIESYEIIENVVTTKAQHKEKKSLETKRDHKFNYSYCFVSNKNWNHKDDENVYFLICFIGSLLSL